MHTGTALCNPTEVALKAFFLGPQAENEPWLLATVQELLQSWCDWRRQAFPGDGAAISVEDQLLNEFAQRRSWTGELLHELNERFKQEIPKFSPRYMGHMFSEISLPALLGHFLTLLHNPNIISREAAWVAADIEDEALLELATMLGCPSAQGHFTSGGTVANYEAVVRARARLYQWMGQEALQGDPSFGYFQAAHRGWSPTQPGSALAAYLPEQAGELSAVRALEGVFGKPFPGAVMIVPAGAHYSWKKAAQLIGLGEQSLLYVGRNAQGNYRVDELRSHLERCRLEDRPVLAVVSVAGTTETGAVDPVDEVQNLLDEYRQRYGAHIWHHVDAAFGGFLCSLLRENPQPGKPFESPLEPRVTSALEAIARTTSITIDPHKLGYVPYASGTFLASDPRDYHCVKTLAPYIDYSSGLDRGPYTLEGSRSAAGAVATWLTARSFGLHQDGYGRLLVRTICQKQKLERELLASVPNLFVAPGCDTNLICFCVARAGESVSLTNARSKRILQALQEQGYILSHTQFPLGLHDYARAWSEQWQADIDDSELYVVRLTLMNPFFDSAELEVSHIQNLVQLVRELA